MTAPFRIGTRGSRLALWQAHYVAERLRPLAGDRPVELVQIETMGDQVQGVPLSEIGGDGLFTKEIQRALLANQVDLAVHSLKDLPTIIVEELILAAVPTRGPTADVFVSRRHKRFDDLPRGAVVATSSLRRRAMMLHRRPDLQMVNLRGNVETRLRKLTEDDANLDALVLAQAGLERLGLEESITEVLDSSWLLPAVGQGALGLECRSEDQGSLALVKHLDDHPSHQAVLAERSLLRQLGGGCLVPIGVTTRIVGDMLHLRGIVLRQDGSAAIEGEITGSAAEAVAVGRKLAEDLLARGAGRLLQLQ